MKKLGKKNNPDREKNKFQKVNDGIDVGKKAFVRLVPLGALVVGVAKKAWPIVKKIIFTA